MQDVRAADTSGHPYRSAIVCGSHSPDGSAAGGACYRGPMTECAAATKVEEGNVMTATTTWRRIASVDELRDIIPAPPPDSIVIRKQLPALDEHARTIIAASPFVLLGTASAAGRCDVTPRGDGPGFVLVLDDRTLVIPDRPGNKRIDSMRNIIENPRAGLLFLVPGMDETLRVNGRAFVTDDPELLGRLGSGARPRSPASSSRSRRSSSTAPARFGARSCGRRRPGPTARACRRSARSSPTRRSRMASPARTSTAR